MARNKKIRVSSEEKKLLDEVSENEYNSTDVPYGVVIKNLCEKRLEDE